MQLTNPEEIIARARREGRVYLLEHECKAILKHTGVPTTHCLVATSEEEAIRMSDAIAKEVRVLPDGKRIRRTHSDWLQDGTQGTVSLPENAIPGTAKVFVKVYPGLFSQVVEGLDGMLRMPFG